jgi:hypothetical protein
MDATQSIEKLIADIEAEQKRNAQLLSDLRAALAKARNGSAPSPASPRKGAPGVFERKYDLNARELISRVLRGNRKALHAGQIHDSLKAQGYEFIKATITLSLKQLHKDNKVRRVKAPVGSGYSHAYLWLPERQPGEESRPEEVSS